MLSIDEPQSFLVWQGENLTRITVPAASAAGAALPERAAIDTTLVDFQVIDEESTHPVPALLLADDGLPMGPLEGPWSRVALPLGFGGSVVSAGYAPVPIRVDESRAGPWRIALRRVACARGSVPPGFEPMSFRITLAERRAPFALPLVASAETDGTGRFHVGPLAPGNFGVGLEAKGVLLRAKSRLVTLAPGPNELGELALERLQTLWLRVHARAPAMPARIYARLWFAGGEAPRDLPGAAHAVEPGGLVVIEDVRDTALAVEVWTADGWSARRHGVEARHSSREAPLEVILAAPANCVVDLEAPGIRLPEGCELVAHPRGGHAATAPFVRAQPLPELRGRRVPCSTSGPTSIDSLWPGAVELTLLSPQGARLASASLDLDPGARQSVVLQASPPLARLVLGNADPVHGRRFALVSARDGATARARVATGAELDLVLAAGRYRVVELESSERDDPVDSQPRPSAVGSPPVDLVAGQVTRINR